MKLRFNPIKNGYYFYLGLMCALLLGLLINGWFIYNRHHGIRFYERPIQEISDSVKVSVIVPVFNAEKSLERALDSLRKQTLKEIEIICVDDGSTDHSYEILKRYAKHDKRIRIFHQTNQFVGGARNRGLHEAKGEYIGFMDDDDWVSRDYFEKLYAAAKKYDADIAVAEKILLVQKEYPLEYQDYALKSPFWGKEVIFDLANYEDKALGFLWEKIYRRRFLTDHNIRFSLRKTSYEDNYFTTQALMYASLMAVARGAEYYYFRGSSSYSLRENHEPTDEAPEMFLELEKIIAEAPLPDLKKKRWFKSAQNIRRFAFIDYYNCLTAEDREIWKQRVFQAFPLDNLPFYPR